mmetsp:Transcript_32674/g.69619  ORF Transcript_32674/g.69619 Transcript_32674/m.69619 type:complete len:99 (-) Transcript_32674:2002-2298(-)
MADDNKKGGSCVGNDKADTIRAGQRQPGCVQRSPALCSSPKETEVRAQESKNETLSDKFFFVGAFIFMPRNVAAHHSPPATSTPLDCTPQNPGIRCLI